MHEYKCKLCGTIKYARYKSLIKKYCSHKCANLDKPRQGKMTTFTCIQCGEKKVILESALKSQIKNNGSRLFCSRKCSGLHSRKRKLVKCGFCEKEFETTRNRYCSVQCVREDRKRKNTPGFWYENGYKVLYIGEGKGIKEHIKVVQDHIGRELREDEVVHHINEIKDDNRLENLCLMTKSAHSKLHRELDKLRGKDSLKKARAKRRKARKAAEKE